VRHIWLENGRKALHPITCSNNPCNKPRQIQDQVHPPLALHFQKRVYLKAGRWSSGYTMDNSGLTANPEHGEGHSLL
jgi:hypothetical protein